jgi:hypothetical protein
VVAAGAGIGAACLAVVFVAWLREFRTPRRIVWQPTTVNGINAAFADGLVLQHDDGNTVWATRGFAVYRSQGGRSFERVFRVRPRIGKAWAGHLASVRSHFGYQELVELLPLGNERFVVFAAGDIYLVDLKAKVIERTHRLRYFGAGKGRGLMAFGLTCASDGTIYFGEYTTEAGPRPVCIWKSSDGGRSWHQAFEFSAGSVRHIHTVQFDAYDGAIWVGTGDRDEHCYVGVSHDGAVTFEWLAQGTQQCRTCGFVFFPEVVLWGMDTAREPNRLILLRRGQATISPHAQLPDATYYHRKLDQSRALLGLAQQLAEIWVANVSGDACRWLSWSVPRPARRAPSPSVRLGRGAPDTATEQFIHVNPIRTVEHDAAIFRLPKSAAPHPADGGLSDRPRDSP